MYKFGKSSQKQLSEVHNLLQVLANSCIKQSDFDFGILPNGGLRTAKQQKELFAKGVTKCDGIKKKSYHQYGMAVDLVPYIDGNYTWASREAFLSIAKTAFQVWAALEDTQGLHLHWGGFWKAKDRNRNHVLDLEDRLGWDLAHFELRSKPQKNTMPIDIYANKMLQEIV